MTWNILYYCPAIREKIVRAMVRIFGKTASRSNAVVMNAIIGSVAMMISAWKDAENVLCLARGEDNDLFYTANPKMRQILATQKHTIIPTAVGRTNEIKVHFMLWVSFLMVMQVVEQGQCINENSMVQIAVTGVHPLSKSSVFNCVRSWKSVRLPCAIYAIIMIGITISLAGNPKINAIKITPSSPMSWANGSRKPEQWASSDASPMWIFAISQISNPAGAATATALPSTNKVRSKMERRMTFPI